MKFAKITRSDKFEKDLKKLLKRFRSLEEDLDIFIRAQLYSYHKLKIDNEGLKRFDSLGFDNPQVFKARKFACKALKGRGAASGIRVVYAYYPDRDEIHFIEMYFKADQEREDRSRFLTIG